MGGHRAGGHASSFAVERFVQLIEESKQTDPIELMKSSIASVNQEMIAESQSNEEYREWEQHSLQQPSLMGK